jgi:Ca2+:H+ antiporter
LFDIEILVDCVDVVLEGSTIPEKFLGITLFALVPNTTEFMNAISFAMNGNIALSVEIGSAYTLRKLFSRLSLLGEQVDDLEFIEVCLLQIPCMLAFSVFYGIGKSSMAHHAFKYVLFSGRSDR